MAAWSSFVRANSVPDCYKDCQSTKHGKTVLLTVFFFFCLVGLLAQ